MAVETYVDTMGDMTHPEVPHFPRGFLLSKYSIAPPPTFAPGPILDNFYVHTWTNVEAAGDRDLFVIILGHCVAIGRTQSDCPARDLLASLRAGEGAFLRALDEYSGRHAIIFGSAGDIRVVNDATGMRSVFYSANGGVVASHALLVERALGEVGVKDDLVFAYGYPGNRTPYARTRILTPNTYYWFTAHLVRRFWPFTSPVERTVDEVAVEALTAASTALRNISRTAPVKMALTAGLDSRVILAVGLHAGIEFETYTYGTNKATALDRAFAPDLAAHAGVPHTLVAGIKPPDGLQHSLQEAHYSPHHRGAVPGLTQFYGNYEAVAVTGNLLEIGRCFYERYRQKGFAAPVDAATMETLHRHSAPSGAQEKIEQYGLDRYSETSIRAFEAFNTETGYDLTVGLLDPFDQFYWEHRMGVWHGPALLERDFYGVAFIPFNSRRIFEAMLGIPKSYRDHGEVFYRMIELVDRDLLELPVNPQHWPPRKRG